jgi:ABC-2 type transport system permease protein
VYLLRLLGAELRLAAAGAAAYRLSLLGSAADALLKAAAAAVPMAVVLGARGSLAGWSPAEAALVLGCFTVLEGLLGAFVEPNLRAVVEMVRDGTFDFVLIRPVDPQLRVSIHRIDLLRVPHAAVGAHIVVAAATQLPAFPGPGRWALGLLLLGAGGLLLHALFTLVVCTSFWWVRVMNLSALLQSGLEAGRWPLDVYRGPARWALTVLLPAGLMSTAPAAALAGRASPALVLGTFALAAAFTLGARAAFRRAIGAYRSASS